VGLDNPLAMSVSRKPGGKVAAAAEGTMDNDRKQIS
jgi:hypothetical protein